MSSSLIAVLAAIIAAASALECYDGYRLLASGSVGTTTTTCTGWKDYCYNMTANVAFIVDAVKGGCSTFRCFLAQDRCISTTFQGVPVSLCCCSTDRCNIGSNPSSAALFLSAVAEYVEGPPDDTAISTRTLDPGSHSKHSTALVCPSKKPRKPSYMQLFWAKIGEYLYSGAVWAGYAPPLGPPRLRGGVDWRRDSHCSSAKEDSRKSSYASSDISRKYSDAKKEENRKYLENLRGEQKEKVERHLNEIAERNKEAVKKAEEYTQRVREKAAEHLREVDEKRKEAIRKAEERKREVKEKLEQHKEETARKRAEVRRSIEENAERAKRKAEEYKQEARNNMMRRSV